VIARSAAGVWVTKQPAIRILIADDHPIFRTGLRAVLQAEKNILIVGEAGDGGEVVKLAERLKPDVLLLDLDMPNTSGLEALRQISLQRLPCRTILLGAAIDKDQILAAIQLGARGVMLKDTSAKLLVDGIRWVAANRFWFGRDRVSDLLQALQAVEVKEGGAPDLERFGLTARERQVIATILSGYTNKDIAQEFSISEETVKRHLSNVFDKLGVSNRLELALFAIHHKLGPEELAVRARDSSHPS
jgi:two-component system nitrate/nitrite response regulator NarL